MAIGGQAMLMPTQDHPEYTDENYIETLRWGAMQYNQRINNVPLINNGNVTANGVTTYINSYVENLNYIFGTQVPAEYGFFAMDANGNETQTPMFRGLDGKKIFDYLHGQATDIIDPLPKTLNVTAYSTGAISAKKETMNYVKWQIDNKVFLNLLQQEAGVGFKVVGRDFESQNQVDKFFTSFQESMEIGYEQIARHCVYYNDYQQDFAKAFDYVIIGNLGVIKPEYINGQVAWRVIAPENAIIDYSKGKDIHKDDDYAGEIFQMPVNEVLSTWDWSEEEIEEIKSIAKADTQSAQVYYQTLAASNVYWWTTSNDVAKVTIVKLAYRSLEKGEDGKRYECIRQGTLIGNRWLRDEGIVKGQVCRKGDRSKKQLPYIVMTPNLFLGTSMSVIGIIKRIANLKDAFITKVIDMSSSSIGKATVIRASKLPEGLRAPDVISQLKQARVIVLEGEEAEDMPNGQKLAETVDLTLDPNIQLILQIVSYLDNSINDYLNIPLQVRGMGSEYQSAKSIDTTQTASAKGLSYLYKNLQLFMKEVLSYSADLYKLMAPDDELGRENLALIVGDGVTDLLSMDVVKKAQFEDFLLTLNPSDYIAAQDKAELSQLMIQIASSNQPIKTMKTYIKLKQTESLTEAYNYLESEMEKEQMQEEARMAQEQEMAMAQNQMNNQTQQQMTETNAQAGLEKQAMADDTKLALGEQKMRMGNKTNQ